MAVLEAFGLHMLHLHPNAVLILATFAHACEAFVSVMPSVALFRHFFMPRRRRSRWIAGGVSFCLKTENARQYPETKGEEEDLELVAAKKAEERSAQADMWQAVRKTG